MRFLLTLSMLMAASASFAAPAVYDCNDGASGNIPQSAGWAPVITITSASAVQQVTVPTGANRVIAAGWGNYAICERPSRCSTFSTSAPNGNGYLLNPNGRFLPTSGGIISVTSPVTGTVVGFEFCKQK